MKQVPQAHMRCEYISATKKRRIKRFGGEVIYNYKKKTSKELGKKNKTEKTMEKRKKKDKKKKKAQKKNKENEQEGVEKNKTTFTAGILGKMK